MAPQTHPVIAPTRLEVLLKMAAELKITIEVLTPELAEKYLANQAQNRRLKRRVWLKYARDMQDGNWGLDGSPIQFNRKGQMLNRQHRCKAVIVTGVSIVVVVIRNVDDGEFVHIDTGTIRTMADVLDIEGEAAATTLGSALRLLYLYNRGLLALPFPPFPSHDEIHDELKAWPLIRDSLEVRKWCRDQISPATTMFFHFLFATIDPEAANEFMTQLGRGEDLHRGMPVYALRDQFTKAQKRKKTLVQREVYAWLIKIWNAFIIGKSLPRVGWSPHEPFPLLLPIAAIRSARGRLS